MASAAALEQSTSCGLSRSRRLPGAPMPETRTRARAHARRIGQHHACAGLAPRRAVLALRFAEQFGLSPAARVRVDRSAGYGVMITTTRSLKGVAARDDLAVGRSAAKWDLRE